MDQHISKRWWFWLGFFLPVDVVFQALWFLARHWHPELGNALPFIVLYKGAYFLTCAYAFLALKTIWTGIGTTPQRIWIYRFLGVASIVPLLGLHAGSVYRFGQTEREIYRTLNAINHNLPVSQEAGVKIDPITLSGNDWIYNSTLTTVTAAQIDQAAFAAAARPLLQATVCGNVWEQHLLNVGIGIRYRYLNSGGHPITDIPFAPGACPDSAGKEAP